MKKLLERIKEITKKDNVSSEILALKATEELGEFAASLFMDSGYKLSKLTKEEIQKNQVEEVIDVVICLFASLEKKGLLDNKSVKKMFIKKLNKWENKLGKKQNKN